MWQRALLKRREAYFMPDLSEVVNAYPLRRAEQVTLPDQNTAVAIIAVVLAVFLAFNREPVIGQKVGKR